MIHSNLYQMDTLGECSSVCLIRVSTQHRFLYSQTVLRRHPRECSSTRLIQVPIQIPCHDNNINITSPFLSMNFVCKHQTVFPCIFTVKDQKCQLDQTKFGQKFTIKNSLIQVFDNRNDHLCNFSGVCVCLTEVSSYN